MKILSHHKFEEYHLPENQKRIDPDYVFPSMCVHTHVHQNRPDSDHMCLYKLPWTVHIVSNCLCVLHTPLLLPSTNLAHPGRGAGAHVSNYHSRLCGVSQRLKETHCELPAFIQLKQRDRGACLNALCFCHNGQDFGGICPFITAH